MARPMAIPDVLHATVIDLTEKGQTGEQISELLAHDFKIQASSRAVQRLVESYRCKTKELCSAMVRTELRKHLLPAVRRVSRAMVRARIMEREAHARAAALRTKAQPQNPAALDEDREALRAIRAQCQCADLLFRFSGLNQSGGLFEEEKPRVGAAERRAALLKRLEEIVKPALPAPAN